MPNNTDIPKHLRKTEKGIVHLKTNDAQEENYGPPESYLEDFEIEKIETLRILETFKPINTDN
jgi:hypothetical protein